MTNPFLDAINGTAPQKNTASNPFLEAVQNKPITPAPTPVAPQPQTPQHVWDFFSGIGKSIKDTATSIEQSPITKNIVQSAKDSLGNIVAPFIQGAKQLPVPVKQGLSSVPQTFEKGYDSLLNQSKDVFNSAYVPPKSNKTEDKITSTYQTIKNLPQSAAFHLVIGPIASLIADAATAGGPNGQGARFTLPLDGAKGVDVKGAQAAYADSINQGDSAQTALVNSINVMVGNLAVAVPIAFDLARLGFEAWSPRSLLKSVEIGRDVVRNLDIGKPVDPEVAQAYKQLPREQKILVAKDLLKSISKPEPSILGKIFGYTDAEAQALFDRIMSEGTTKIPIKQLKAGEQTKPLNTEATMPQSNPFIEAIKPTVEPVKLETLRGNYTVADTPKLYNDAIRDYKTSGISSGTRGIGNQGLKIISELSQRPEIQSITKKNVTDALASGELPKNQDGTITVYRTGVPGVSDRLVSTTTDKAHAQEFAGEGKQLMQANIKPEDIQAYIGGMEKEILVQGSKFTEFSPNKAKLAITNPREAAKDLIRKEVLRGDTIKQIMSTYAGVSNGKYDASVGGYLNDKKISNGNIIVKKLNGLDVNQVFSLQDIYKEIQAEKGVNASVNNTDKNILNYDDLLNEKIKLRQEIAKLEPTVSDNEKLMNTGKGRKLATLKTQLNYTENAMGKIKQESDKDINAPTNHSEKPNSSTVNEKFTVQSEKLPDIKPIKIVDNLHVAELKVQVNALEEALQNSVGRKLAKYANKNGELPEVIGHTNSKYGNYGDSIITELGLTDTEDAAFKYAVYRQSMADLAELKDALREAKQGVDGDYSEADMKKINDIFQMTYNNMSEAGFIDASAILDSAKKALAKFDEYGKDVAFGELLRTYFVGEKNVRIADTNQLASKIQKTMSDHTDQEALSIYRDYKDDIKGLQHKLDLYKSSDNIVLQRLVPVIERALQPTEAMLKADTMLTSYFETHLSEGKRLGFLDSTIDNASYISHLLEPKEVSPIIKGFFNKSMSRNFQFAKTRTYKTLLDAVEAGIRPRTINAVTSLRIYGSNFATTAATKLLLKLLKDSELGKFGSTKSPYIPKDWVNIAPGNRLFENNIPIMNKEGKPDIAHQALYVPQKVATALAPIINPDLIARVNFLRNIKLYQGYLKAVELSLSVFHIKALNFVALANMGPGAIVDAYKADLESPLFQEKERLYIKHGLTTPVLGQTIEAIQEVNKTAIPSRTDLLSDIPGMRTVQKISRAVTRFTFDVTQRKFKVMDMAMKEAAWIAKHPKATPEEYAGALRFIAKEINSVYGGLNWDIIGVGKTALSVSRFILLAPDWTYSNFLTTKYAFQGGAGGAAARKFWIIGILLAMALTEGMSKLLSGHFSKNPTKVYIGKDKVGKDITTNMFFVASTGDLVNLINNLGLYGFPQGVIQTLTPKAAPILRELLSATQNRNYLGQQVVVKGSGGVRQTIAFSKELLSNLSPIPFSIANFGKMFTDPNKEYTKKEYINNLFNTPSKHEVPAGYRSITSGRNKGQLAPATPRNFTTIWEYLKTGKLYQPITRSRSSAR